MTWVRYTTARGGDARPINSALMLDVVRGNISQLMEESPAAFSFELVNGDRTTTAAAYGESAVLLFFPPMMIRAHRVGQQPRSLRFHFFANTSAGSGNIRVWAAAFQVIPGVTPDGTTATGETSALAVGASAWRNVDVTMNRTKVNEEIAPILGGFEDDERDGSYMMAYIGVQGKTSAGTLTLESMYCEEIL